MNIFSTIADKIGSFFKKEVPVVETAFTSTNGAVNILKLFLGSVTGQILQAILDALFPGIAPAIFADLNVFFTDYGLVQSEVGKSPADIAADGLNDLSKLSGNSKILALSNVAAIIAHSASSATGGGTTLQQAIVTTPIVYNPAVLGVVDSEVVAPVVAN